MILRRRRLWFIVLVGLMLAGGVWLWAISNSLWVSDKNRIAVGMTRTQVIAELGTPSILDGKSGLAIWIANDGNVSVQFGQDDKVDWIDGESHSFFYWQWLLLNNRIFPPVVFVPPPPPVAE